MTSRPLTGTPNSDDRSIRDRILEGLAASIRERGYALTRVGDIVRHANTSRRTLYETFSTKDECFAALLDRIGEHLCSQMNSAVDPIAPRAHQVRQAVAGFIEFVAAEPELSRSWVRDMAVGGSFAAKARRRSTNRIADIMLRLGEPAAKDLQGLSPVRRSTAVMLVSGLCELAVGVIEDGGNVRAITEVAVQAAVSTFGDL